MDNTQPQTVNVVSPENELGSLPVNQIADAQKYGYRIASPEEVTEHFRQEKFGTPGQQAITFLEGAGRGSTLG